MSLHRRAAKRDDSEGEVVDAFLDGGATVIKHTGKDECDLIVAYRGRWHAVEVKTGNRKRTKEQVEWAEAQAAPVHECRNEAQARKLMRVWDLEFADRSRLEAEDAERKAAGA